MISLNDIIRDDETRGERRLRLGVRALLRALIVIGQLPRSRVREELLAAYDGRDDSHNGFHRLIPRGFGVERDLRASDVEELSLQERVAFLKGAALLLGDRLRSGQDCICNMPAAVILPVAAYASLLREDVGLARKTWKTFAKILASAPKSSSSTGKRTSIISTSVVGRSTSSSRNSSATAWTFPSPNSADSPPNGSRKPSSWSVIAPRTGFKPTIKPRY